MLQQCTISWMFVTRFHNCFQSSRLVGAIVNVCESISAYFSPGKRSVQSSPSPRNRFASSPPISSSAKSSHLRGVLTAGSLRATIAASRGNLWGPSISGHKAVVWLNPISCNNICQRSGDNSGWLGRKSRSVNFHQPSVKPKVISAQRAGSLSSIRINIPPGANNCWTFASV